MDEISTQIRLRRSHDFGIQGSYGTGNIGDKALGERFYEEIQARGRSVEMFNHTTESSNAPNRVLGGGGVLHDWYGTEHLKTRLAYATGGKKAFAIGVGVPGFQSPEGRDLASRVLPELDLITVRDEWSKSNIEAVCDTDVTVTACPVWLYDDPQEPTSDRTGINFRPYFGEKEDMSESALRDHFGYTDLENATERYIENIKRICKFVDNPVFIPFTPKDEKFAQKYLDIPIWPYTFSVEKTLKRVSNVERMVATRYHSLVFASICRKPILPLAYEPKVEEVAERLDLPYYKPHKDIKIEFVSPSGVDRLRTAARENFDLLFEAAE
ncbi:polysaccharide pyruvyl transferase family protein [Halalkalicoccus subterraneus]|uniref:polysaccharide pyruvyl transferase family protein n=1 Tax=Halalkalicoccus subterraneus TaxID=2675002 RepID=UPI000EFD3045|nr:polysaccharide pyruvyl transferase family protein [Halalkalicoccus subterraneus]